MKVFVKEAASSCKVELTLPAGCTVAQLGQSLETNFSVPIGEQLIIQRGKKLVEQSHVLDDSCEGSTFMLMRNRSIGLKKEYINLRIMNLKKTMTIDIQVHPSYTVDEVFMAVRKSKGVPLDGLRLYYDGIFLDSHRALFEYGIKNNSPVYLVKWVEVPRNMRPDNNLSKDEPSPTTEAEDFNRRIAEETLFSSKVQVTKQPKNPTLSSSSCVYSNAGAKVEKKMRTSNVASKEQSENRKEKLFCGMKKGFLVSSAGSGSKRKAQRSPVSTVVRKDAKESRFQPPKDEMGEICLGPPKFQDLSTPTRRMSLSEGESSDTSKDKTPRCGVCKKKVNTTALLTRCKCGGVFCPHHRYPTDHPCPVNYRQLNQEHLAAELQVIDTPKVEKI